MFETALVPSEFLGFTLCVLVLFFVLYVRKILLTPAYSFFTYAFFYVTAAFMITNLEELLLEDLLNVLEHALMAAGVFYIAVGCRRLLLDAKSARRPGP